MELHCDGYTIGGNPSLRGGGFTVMDESAKLLKTEELEGFITNNEAELRGIVAALQLASEGDKIITDSMNCLWWLKRGHAKARPDLNFLIMEANRLQKEKKVSLEWRRRDQNLAGQYNEMFFE